jgi:hypothetical protein
MIKGGETLALLQVYVATHVKYVSKKHLLNLSSLLKSPEEEQEAAEEEVMVTEGAVMVMAMEGANPK